MVLYALVPTVALHVVFFGPGLLIQIVLGVVDGAARRSRWPALATANRCARFLHDGSAIITAVLLALCLPPLAPWWLIVSGIAFAILLAKHLYRRARRESVQPRDGRLRGAARFVSRRSCCNGCRRTSADIEPASLSFGDTLNTILTGTLPARLTWDAITSPTPLDALRTESRTWA